MTSMKGKMSLPGPYKHITVPFCKKIHTISSSNTQAGWKTPHKHPVAPNLYWELCPAAGCPIR